MQDQLLFVIGPPRSGSTLLARMLGTNPAVHSPAEPHLLTPLAHLGFFASVEQAPYDPIVTQAAARELVADLPGGETDYLDALRAYTDVIYARLLEPSGRKVLLDKTPGYALVLDFAARLYPGARYVVLTRHPLAVWSSFAESFFDGDHAVAHAHNPLLERYVPAIARFLREAPVPICHVRYEALVREPEAELRRICEFAGLDFDPGMVNYGEQEGGVTKTARGLGDPVSVQREKRPTTRSLARWASDLAGQPEAVALCARILESLTDEDLETWGYARREIEAELDAVDLDAPRQRRSRWNQNAIERAVVVRLRRNIHHNALGRIVRRIRFYCDALLR
ncbi:MAG: sulfotransferase [Proteobacteria bacterium]|nr:sulfotransferase [Pseudomonadota bacterium]